MKNVLRIAILSLTETLLKKRIVILTQRLLKPSNMEAITTPYEAMWRCDYEYRQKFHV